MEKDQEFDFESFKQEAINGMYAGKPLNGEKGIFAPLLKHFLESGIRGSPAEGKGSGIDQPQEWQN
jgi:hypothetical protein